GACALRGARDLQGAVRAAARADDRRPRYHHRAAAVAAATAPPAAGSAAGGGRAAPWPAPPAPAASAPKPGAHAGAGRDADAAGARLPAHHQRGGGRHRVAARLCRRVVAVARVPPRPPDDAATLPCPRGRVVVVGDLAHRRPTCVPGWPDRPTETN